MMLAFYLSTIIVCSGYSTTSGIYKRSAPKTAEDCQDECEYRYSEINAGCQIGSSVACAGESAFAWLTGGGVCQGGQSICDGVEAGSVFDNNNCKRRCSRFQSEFEQLFASSQRIYNKMQQLHSAIEDNGKKLLLAIGDLDKSILDNYFKDNRDELMTADSYYENYKRSKTELSKNQYIEVVLGQGRLTGRSLWPNGWEKLMDMVADGDGLKHNVYKNKAANHSYCSPEWYNFFSYELFTATMHISRAHYLNGGQLSERNIDFLKTGLRKHKNSYEQACQGGTCCYSCLGTCNGFYTGYHKCERGDRRHCAPWSGTKTDARYCRGSSRPPGGCCDIWKECNQDCPENCPKISCFTGEEYLGNCYLLVETYKTWLNAANDCKARNGALVTINNAGLNNFIGKLAENTGVSSWIGATDAQTEGVWKWSSGDNVRFADWFDDNPNNYAGNQNCAAINFGGTGKWDDDHCEARKPYVCQGLDLIK